MHKRQLQTLVYDNFDAALTIRLNYYLNSLAIVFSMLSDQAGLLCSSIDIVLHA